jgi:uncharacterized membrane protein YkvA (DUF1232 family)
MQWVERMRTKARELKHETYALYLAARHPQTPWFAKLLVAAIVGYALSPIDLIPDFVPILGYLDDLVLLPLGIAWAIRLIPAQVMTECRERARATVSGKPRSMVAAAIIILVWLAVLAAIACWGYRWWTAD